jgi:osmotically-inducible protein OsmY
MMKKLLYIALAGMALVQLQACSTTPVGGEAGGPGTLDRRTAGAVIGDQEIEIRSKNRLRDAFPIKVANGIASTSYNRQLLLTGQVPDEATRARASEVVQGIPELRAVLNELSVSGGASLTSKANDTSITGQVKTRLLRDDRVPGTQIKVVTETGVVYLMGLVNRAEAAAATEVARTTSGVAKVVVLFEYLD